MSVPVSPIYFFGAAFLFAVVANMSFFILVARCNQRLPDGQKISYFFARQTVIGELRCYRRLYPDGKLHFLFGICAVLALISFVFGAWVKESLR